MPSDSAHLPDAHAFAEQGPDTERTSTAVLHLAPLVPMQPPGRITRKARHYVAQIACLRDQGYTLETIQQALAAVGINVSISTVRREAMRPLPSSSSTPERPRAERPRSPAMARAAAPAADVPPPSASNPGAASGKDLAEAYARSRSTNPLVRAKEHSS